MVPKVLLTESILKTIEVLEKGKKTLVVVVDANNMLCGTVTDGDVRRGILNGVNLASSVSKIMNQNSITAPKTVADNELLSLMVDNKIEALPIVDDEKRVLKVVHRNDVKDGGYKSESSGFEAAIIMAGGEGRRLRPLTNDVPKPMLKVGGVPIIERQIIMLQRQGIRKIYISINYLGDKIRDYLRDGSSFGVSIEYLEEKEKLGTAGAVSLLPVTFSSSVLVLNGDVLTSINYGSLYDFHSSHDSVITMAAISYNIDIPYGVVRTDGARAIALDEKPSQHFLCNAGIYALSPKGISMIPKDTFFNMTDLIDLCLKNSKDVIVFPVHEYWSDIGTQHEYDKASRLFSDSEI